MRRRGFLSGCGWALAGCLVRAQDARSAPFDREAVMRWFSDQEYGHSPEGIESVFEWGAATEAAAGVVRQESALELAGKEGGKLLVKPLLFRPAGEGVRYPVVVFLNNRGPQEMVLGEGQKFWPVARIVERGWATMGFDVKEVAHDEYKEFEKNRGLYDLDAHAEGGTKGGALSAWAFVAELLRAQLAQRDDVDPGRICVAGHSRGGKCALLTGARYPGFHSAYSSCSGCGGAAQHRTKIGEKIAQITKVFPHWFCGNFRQWAGRDAELPHDQHELLGCLAPRHVHVGSATDDEWADPDSEYLSCQLASPLHKAAGAAGLVRDDDPRPKPGELRGGGSLSYHIRDGRHDLEPSDWEHYLDAVEQHDKQRA